MNTFGLAIGESRDIWASKVDISKNGRFNNVVKPLLVRMTRNSEYRLSIDSDKLKPSVKKNMRFLEYFETEQEALDYFETSMRGEYDTLEQKKESLTDVQERILKELHTLGV